MPEKRAHVIVVANQKGGCAKTTTAVNLAGGLAQKGFQTCLVDLDSQCNATTTFGIQPEELKEQAKLTVADAFLASKPASAIEIQLKRFDGNLSVLPGHRSLEVAKAKLEADIRTEAISDDLSPYEEDDRRKEHRLRLRKSLNSLVTTRDYIIIDTPPRLSFELTAALVAADWYIIPVKPSLYDVTGLTRLQETVNKVRKRENANVRMLGILIGFFKPNTNLCNDIRDKLKSEFGSRLFDTVINDSIRFGESPFKQETIYEYAAGQPSSEQFEKFTDEVIERLNRVVIESHARPQDLQPAPTSAPSSLRATEMVGVVNE